MKASIIQHTEDWYGGKIPAATSPSFPGFFAGNIGIAKAISDEVEEVRVENVESAYAERSEGKAKIVVPAFALAAYSDAEHAVGGNVKSIAMANGIIVHEAAHFAYSPRTIGEILAAGGYAMYNGKSVPTTLSSCANLVEDVYIEWNIVQDFPYLKPFIEAAHDFFFDFAKIVDITKDRDSNDILNEMIYSKSWYLLDTIKDWGKGLPFIEKLKTARTMHDLADRGQLAISLYNDLFAGEVREQEKKDGEGEGEKEGGEDGDGKGKSGSGKPKNEKVVGPTGPEEALYDEHGLGQTYQSKEAKRNVTAKIAAIAKVVNDIIQENEEDSRPITSSKDAMIGAVSSTIVEIMPSAANPLPIRKTSEFDGLGKRLSQKMSAAHVSGQALARGRKLVSTRLARIATDGKIFANDVVLKRIDRKWEFDILVDLSGSMERGREGSKRFRALTAAASAFEELVKARLKTRVWGHTQLIGHDLIVYAIANSTKDTFITAYRKASTVLGHDGGNNIDGYAIKRVKDFISKDKSYQRVLIVISDGAPSGVTPDGRYSSDNGAEHTKRVVDGLRKEGIIVVSISIEDNAVKTNNMIYGEKNNINSSDPNILSKLIGTLVS